MQKTLIAVLLAGLGASAMAAGGYTGLGTESVSQETLSRYRPQPIDSALSRRIQFMLDVRGAGGGMLSPDGKRLYYTSTLTGTPQVWRMDQPMGYPIQMTGGEDRTHLAGITADGKWLVILRDRNGEENPGLYLQPALGGPLVEIQHKPKVQTSYQFSTDDSRFIYYTANDETPDSYTVYRYDLNSRSKEKLFSQKGHWSISDHQPDGTLLLTKSLSNSISEHYEWDPKTNQLTPLLGQNEQVDYSVAYGPTAGELIVQTNKFGEFQRLYRYRDGKFTPLSPELKWDIDGFSLDKQRKRLYYAVNEGGYTKSYVLDAKSGQPLALPKLPQADHISLSPADRSGRYANVGIDTATSPSTTYMLDWKTGKLIQWRLSSSPEVDTSRFAVASLEYYPARDGTKIPMFVRRPAKCDPAPCPVIVDFHGGPEGQSTAGFSAYNQLFVDAGFIHVEPNVRGSSGYGKTWLDADNGAKRLQVVSDIEDAARFIRANWGANGKAPKIGITGGSYGGYATLAGMTMFAGSYDAGVAAVAPSNLLTFLENTAPYRRAIRIAEYGDPVKDRDALIALSPINHLDKLKAPLLIIQGATDPRVPVGEAVQMHEAAKNKGLDSELILFADEGHGFSKRSNRVLSIGHTLRFFETHLKGAQTATAAAK
ncbi:S9 family peptidase [Chitinimonas lacunae]|uniref:Prolyl oligopeptidase family serine peptidase n=1 Tax=Chitinimonas lacunae TaxID=1963018 RepID=A0ABV8MLE4_9NEIS